MYLLFDIGGTKMRWSVSSDGKSIAKPVILQTPKNYEEAMRLIEKNVLELTSGTSIKKTVGGIRRLNETKDMLLPDFRLPDWSGKPLKKSLEKITKSEVFLENDTALVGLGEAVHGAGKSYEIVAYLTISTGVGGVRIVDKKIDANSIGFEPGHQIIDLDWSLYPGNKELFEKASFGQLEAYISGASVEKIKGKKAKEVDDEVFWLEISEVLTAGVVNAIVFWSPEVIVLGGGMMGTPGVSIEKVREKIKSYLKIFETLPEIKKAELADFGGLHGALAYLKNKEK